MKIDKFKVEEWFNKYEKDAVYDLADTCVESLSINELLDFVYDKEKELMELFSNLFCSFLTLSAPNTVLSEPVLSTASTCSEPVYGQKCGQNRFPQFAATFQPSLGSGFVCEIVA